LRQRLFFFKKKFLIGGAPETPFYIHTCVCVYTHTHTHTHTHTKHTHDAHKTHAQQPERQRDRETEREKKKRSCSAQTQTKNTQNTHKTHTQNTHKNTRQKKKYTQEAFEKRAAARFGSGWVWLCVNRNTDKLEIVSTGNQENPLMTTTSFAGTPLLYPFLGLDVWEHSYYLKYLGARKQYVKAWFKVINWSQVSRYYEVFSINGLAVEWWR